MYTISVYICACIIQLAYIHAEAFNHWLEEYAPGKSVEIEKKFLTHSHEVDIENYISQFQYSGDYLDWNLEFSIVSVMLLAIQDVSFKILFSNMAFVRGRNFYQN